MRKTLHDFGKMLVDMKIDTVLSIIVSILTTIGTASKILSVLENWKWINENVRSFLLSPLILTVCTVFYMFTTFLVLQFIGNGFVEISRFRVPKRKAKLTFPIPPRGREILFEVHNSENKLELSDVSILLYDAQQLRDKFGKLPIEGDAFSRQYVGIGHKPTSDRALACSLGEARAISIPAKQSAFFYLFEIDEYGSMSIPKIKLGLEKLPKGEYVFSFQFEGYMKKKHVPRFMVITVKNTGFDIVIENIEPRK